MPLRNIFHVGSHREKFDSASNQKVAQTYPRQESVTSSFPQDPQPILNRTPPPPSLIELPPPISHSAIFDTKCARPQASTRPMWGPRLYRFLRGDLCRIGGASFVLAYPIGTMAAAPITGPCTCGYVLIQFRIGLDVSPYHPKYFTLDATLARRAKQRHRYDGHYNPGGQAPLLVGKV